MWQRVAIIGITPALIWCAAPAHADETRQEVCGAYNLGIPPAQIGQDLQRGDGRITPYDAWRDSTWAIVEGDCG